MPGELEHVSPGEPIQPTARDWNGFVDAANAFKRRRVAGGGNPFTDPLTPSLECLIKNTGSSATTLAAFSVQAYSTPLISPATDEPTRLRANVRPVFEGATPSDASAPFVITTGPIRGQQIGRAIVSGLAVVQVNVSDASHTRAQPIVGTTSKLESCESGGVPMVWKESGTGDKWAMVLLDFGGSSEAASPVTFSNSVSGSANMSPGSGLFITDTFNVTEDGTYLLQLFGHFNVNVTLYGGSPPYGELAIYDGLAAEAAFVGVYKLYATGVKGYLPGSCVCYVEATAGQTLTAYVVGYRNDVTTTGTVSFAGKFCGHKL